jgi:hypothetical protein
VLDSLRVPTGGEGVVAEFLSSRKTKDEERRFVASRSFASRVGEGGVSRSWLASGGWELRGTRALVAVKRVGRVRAETAALSRGAGSSREGEKTSGRRFEIRAAARGKAI